MPATQKKNPKIRKPRSKGPKFVATPKQTLALKYLRDDTHTQILYGGGAGGGKSVLGCYHILKNAIAYPETQHCIGRAVRKTLYDTTVKTFRRLAKHLGLVPGIHYKENDAKSNAIFFNGSEIIFKDLKYMPSDDDYDDLGSLELTSAFVDECPEVMKKGIEVLSSRIRFKLTGIDKDGNPYKIKPKLLMTCNPAKGYPYTDFYKPWKDGSLLPFRAFIPALITDNPNIEPEYVANLNNLDNYNLKQRLLYGNWEFDDREGVLIPYNKCLEFFHNEYVARGTERFITADIATQGSDRFVICVWAGWTVIHMTVINKNNYKDVENTLRDLEFKFRVPRTNVVYDTDGVGGFLQSYYRDAIPFHNGAPPIHIAKIFKEDYQNLKAQCYFKFAKKVAENQARFDFEAGIYKELIVEELASIRDASVGTDRKLAVPQKKDWKDELGRSPDFTDALMMRAYFDIAPRKRYISRGN